MNERLDRDVETILQDDESDAQTLRQNLQQMTSNNDVNMIWGVSPVCWLPPGAPSPKTRTSVPRHRVRLRGATPQRQLRMDVRAVPEVPRRRSVDTRDARTHPESERPNRVGIWEPNSGWGQEQADYWENRLGDAGYNIVLRETFEIGSQDFSTLISQSQNADVEVLLSNPTPGGGITAINQMQSNNWSPQMLKFVRGADPSAWWSALGDAGAYALMCPGWVPGLTGNGNQRLRESYMSEYDTESQYMPVNVGGSYNLTQVALQAVQAAESTEADAIQSALRSETFQTVIGEFGFEDNGLPAEGDLTAPTGQWWDGAQRLAYPTQTPSAHSTSDTPSRRG